MPPPAFSSSTYHSASDDLGSLTPDRQCVRPHVTEVIELLPTEVIAMQWQDGGANAGTGVIDGMC